MRKLTEVELVKSTENEVPSYETKGAAGCDVRAELNNLKPNFMFDTTAEVSDGKCKSITIQPLGRCLIPTGLFVSIPEGYEIQVRPRSGLALKKGLTLANCVGTIDSDYRDECGVIAINLSKEPITIFQGERICQFVLAKVEKIGWVLVEKLGETTRKGGFGSTGTK